MPKICVVGASGRMGKRVLACAQEAEGIELASVLQHRNIPEGLSEKVLCTADADAAFAVADVIIDFSAPPAVALLLPAAIRAGCAYVLASTGLEENAHRALEKASGKIAIVAAANFSVGVNALALLVEKAAAILGDDADVEVMEIHHRHKRDAPSGTALFLGEAVEAGSGKKRAVMGRQGMEPPRESDQLGYAALRGGSVAGEHTVYFFGADERIELTHRATSRDIFAQGALRAARWLEGKPAGFYGMGDVLGL